jgi:hypothetical protein
MRKAWWASTIAGVIVASACHRGEDKGRGEERVAGDGAAAEALPERASDERAPGQASRRAARGKRAASAAASVRRVEGKLERATSERVVIRRGGREPLTLRVGPGTSVTVDGRAARAEALPQGTDVRAAYQVDDGRATALSIDARTRGGAPGEREGFGGR